MQLYVFTSKPDGGYEYLGELRPERVKLPSPDEFLPLLEASRYRTVESPYRDLLIDGSRYRLLPP